MRGSTPIAYLLTLRTFGTWLHGDTRGSHHRLRCTHGTPGLPSRPHLEAAERSQMRSPRQLLDSHSRAIVERVVREVCEFRGWNLLAANARTNHVHLVVTAGCPPEEAGRSIKSWITHRLVHAAHALQGPCSSH